MIKRENVSPPGNVFLTTPYLVLLKTKLKPVSVRKNLAAEGYKYDQQDKPASAAGAGCSPPKTKAVLEPIK